MAIIAITTSNSINVKARRVEGGFIEPPEMQRLRCRMTAERLKWRLPRCNFRTERSRLGGRVPPDVASSGSRRRLSAAYHARGWGPNKNAAIPAQRKSRPRLGQITGGLLIEPIV